jgi:murein DD-endopeptidase MepM/ murein hydrolase activator NlpD
MIAVAKPHPALLSAGTYRSTCWSIDPSSVVCAVSRNDNPPPPPVGGPFLWTPRVVHVTMRLLTFTAASLLAATACARPVLYYPTPEPGPVQAGSPVAIVTPDSAVTSAVVADAASDSREADVEYARSRRILMPVAGASIAKVADSFDESRDGGERVHHALDILAPRGTPILAADDGTILRMTTSSLGGISMYTVDPEHRVVYYYAHMDHYHPSMVVGRMLVRGDTLGFVGTTGNAPKDTPHLHFQIMRMPEDGKYWIGEPINPYPLLGGVKHIAKQR